MPNTHTHNTNTYNTIYIPMSVLTRGSEGGREMRGREGEPSGGRS